MTITHLTENVQNDNISETITARVMLSCTVILLWMVLGVAYVTLDCGIVKMADRQLVLNDVLCFCRISMLRYQ